MTTDSKPSPTRLSLDIGPKSKARLERVAEETEQSLAKVVRDALAVYTWLWDGVKAGNTLVMRGPDGETEVVIPELRAAALEPEQTPHPAA